MTVSYTQLLSAKLLGTAEPEAGRSSADQTHHCHSNPDEHRDAAAVSYTHLDETKRILSALELRVRNMMNFYSSNIFSGYASWAVSYTHLDVYKRQALNI